MSARENILRTVKAGQPAVASFDDALREVVVGDVNTFIGMLEGTGGVAVRVSGISACETLIRERFPEAVRVVSTVQGILASAEITADTIPHTLQDVDVAIVAGAFGVAENGAVWIEDVLPARALPFIAQHLVLVLRERDIIGNMEDAYARIGNADYGYGVFISGPSKTADIEQSLVQGAHGPVSVMVILVGRNES